MNSEDDREPIVQLHHVSKNYGRHPALRDVSVELRPGLTGLLGPNGAGKSTLIKILLSLVRVTSGEGTILGYRIGKERRLLLERVGYMPEDDCYLPGLSAVEIVQFAGRLCRLPKKEALRRAHEILDFCGMGQERYRMVETFSTGMRQKLKFACTLVHDPELLILDEPTSGLDPEERMLMLSRIRGLAEKCGKSVLLCTHILPDVEMLGGYVVILSAGRVRLADTHKELCRPASPQVVVQVQGDADRFRQYVTHRGIEVTAADGNRLVLQGDVDSLLSEVWGWAQACQVGLSRVMPAINSLQQVFLDAVREDRHAAV